MFWGYSADTTVESINEQKIKNLLGSLVQLPLTDEERAKLQSWENPPAILTISKFRMVHQRSWPRATCEIRFQTLFFLTAAKGYQVNSAPSLDFKNPKSADVINDWTKRTTNGMIPKIIDSEYSPLNFCGSCSIQPTLKAIGCTRLESQPLRTFISATAKQFKFRQSRSMVVRVFMKTTKFKWLSFLFIRGEVKAYVVLPKSAADFAELSTYLESGLWSCKKRGVTLWGLSRTDFGSLCHA